MVSLFSALLTTDAAGSRCGIPTTSPGRRLAMVLGLVAVLIRARRPGPCRRRSRTGRGRRARRSQSVRRERWTLPRGVAVGSALISFYVTYLSYRNLKSVVPLLRPGDLFDHDTGRLRSQPVRRARSRRRCYMTLLGTGVQTHFLSGAYMLFFAFIPGTLAFALVFSRNLQSGLLYVTAQSINWLLAAASYFLAARAGARLPRAGCLRASADSAVTQLQDLLLDQRRRVPSRPGGRRGAEHRRPSPRCTCRSSSPPRWWHSCSDSPRPLRIGGVVPARLDDRGHDLPRMALRRRRPRRPRARRARDRPGPRPDRAGPAHRAAAVRAERSPT